MKKEFPGGVWPVMLTPFTDENKVDYESLQFLLFLLMKEKTSH